MAHIPQSLIELHDVRFAVAERIEDTYEELRRSWWGKPGSLHIDAWGILDTVDGFEIQLKTKPQTEGENKLFFVNLGGYDKNEFAELHKNVFVVAKNASKAKVKALEQILHWQSHHKDYQYDIDGLIDVNNALANQNHFIHLTPNERHKLFEFNCGLIMLNELAPQST